MRKLGLRDETNDFFHNLHEEVIGGTNLAALREQYLKKPEEWYQLLQTHLTIAAGWLTLGFHDRAAPTLDYVRHELLDPQASQTYSSHPYTQIVRSYVFAIGHGGCASGIVRIIDLFTKMPPQRIDNAWTGSMHYSLYHLNVIEDVILALVSDEFALGPAGRRWLDDDEYLVRQRIHADMKRERERHGL
jgi:hypothetical protein